MTEAEVEAARTGRAADEFDQAVLDAVDELHEQPENRHPVRAAEGARRTVGPVGPIAPAPVAPPPVVVPAVPALPAPVPSAPPVVAPPAAPSAPVITPPRSAPPAAQPLSVPAVPESFRLGYTDYLRTASTTDLLFAVLPGSAGSS
ncbi:hypothetical protein H7H51_01545 [Mycolicibacterium farcinogenes]|nr:hypothetical protein [Mycolicibacterium farcinogenes]